MNKENQFAINWYILKKTKQNTLPWELSKKGHKVRQTCVEGKSGIPLFVLFWVGIISYFKSHFKSFSEYFPNWVIDFLKYEEHIFVYVGGRWGAGRVRIEEKVIFQCQLF